MPINIIDTMKPKNNGTFPIVEAPDVKVGESQRLSSVLPTIYNGDGTITPIMLLTQDEYDDLLQNETYDEHTVYIIYEASGE